MEIPPPPDGDRTKGPGLLAANIVITIVALITVALRMYARHFVIHNVGWDDYTILIAMAMCIVSMILIIIDIRHGLGRHGYYVSLDNLVMIGLHFHILEILYELATAIIKISACLFLLRIMGRASTKFINWFLCILMISVTAVCVATGFIILFQCFPVQAGWDPRVKGKCLSFPSILGIGYAQSAFSVVTDLVCAAFPIIILRKLKINHRVKLALWAVMSLGVLTSISCIIKLVYLKDLSNGDFTYNGVNVSIWSSVEQNIGIIACSIPALHPLFKKYFESLTTKNSSKPGAKSSGPVLSAWKESKAKAFGSRSSRSRTFQTITNDTSSEERILAEDKGKEGITKTTDVELFYAEAGKPSAKTDADNSIEMV